MRWLGRPLFEIGGVLQREVTLFFVKCVVYFSAAVDAIYSVSGNIRAAEGTSN